MKNLPEIDQHVDTPPDPAVQLALLTAILSNPQYERDPQDDPFWTDVHDKVSKLVRENAAHNEEASQTSTFLRSHLKMWKDPGIPAPVNELQSISGWLRTSAEGMKPMQKAMRNRIILLLREVAKLANEGIEAEIREGLYDNRPDLLEERVNSLTEDEQNRIKLVREGERITGGDCTHPPGCTLCAWCGFGVRDKV